MPTINVDIEGIHATWKKACEDYATARKATNATVAEDAGVKKARKALQEAKAAARKRTPASVELQEAERLRDTSRAQLEAIDAFGVLPDAIRAELQDATRIRLTKRVVFAATSLDESFPTMSDADKKAFVLANREAIDAVEYEDDEDDDES